MGVPFVKMHGAANDFVVVDHRRPSFGPDPGWVRAVCDRRRGVGADGVLLLEADPEVDFAMRYFNADGGAADYCGNGARCIARYALALGCGDGVRVRFRTAVGIQEARDAGSGRIALEFGQVASPGELLRIAAAGRSFAGRFLVAGVPHFVTRVPDLDQVPVAEWGAALRRHPAFGVAGANIDFVAPSGDGYAMRTFERGVEGETLACGSGAIASAIVAHLDGMASPVRIRTRGGDDLMVGLVPAGTGWEVRLTGPAEFVFQGVWNASAAKEERCSKA